MTEPRTPDDQRIEPPSTPPATDAIGTTDATDTVSSASSAAESVPTDDSPTQAWPSIATPGATGPDSPARPGSLDPPNASTASLYESAESLPATRVGAVGDAEPPAAATSAGGRSRLRWGLALVGVLIVAAGSFAIMSLVGGRPSPSAAMGYMPPDTFSYTEARIDLPGDQRQKLASFLKVFPGFDDPSAIEPKIDEVFDRIVRAATKDEQTWTTDIKPWFGGSIAFGASLPDPATATPAMAYGAESGLFVVTVSDRAKAIAWLTKTADGATLARSTHGDADLFAPPGPESWAVAINDKVMLAGVADAVRAALDTGGKGAFDQSEDVKAALATLDKDFVLFGVTRTRAIVDSALELVAKQQPGVLEGTQIDDTIIPMIPAWQAMTARFENDALVSTTAGPSWSIGYESGNGPSDVVGHVPAKTVFYVDIHDVGPNLTALLAKFRGLDEAKPAFAQLDQALNLLGGPDAVYGWWGDTALVVSALADGTIGGGLVIHPTDAAKADRLFTTLNGFLALGGSSAGVTTRTEDHNGTKVTIIDFSKAPGASTTDLPPGYKPEFAWASNANVAVIGYGSAFVKAVLDAGPGASLGDDARFKGLLGRVGAENLGVAFLDIAAIRALVEPLAQAEVPADAWAHYVKEIQPYLAPLDAVISGVRKDNGLDRGTGVFTAH